MQAVQMSGDWSGILIAGGIALALIAGLYLVQWAWRSWIRYRTGFGTSASASRAEGIEDLPDDEALPHGGTGPGA